MKVTVEEYDSSFSIGLTPETMAEAGLCVRLGLNYTKETDLSSYVFRDKTFYVGINIQKRKRVTPKVGRE